LDGFLGSLGGNLGGFKGFREGWGGEDVRLMIFIMRLYEGGFRGVIEGCVSGSLWDLG
jgi:hypothetical protein